MPQVQFTNKPVCINVQTPARYSLSRLTQLQARYSKVPPEDDRSGMNAEATSCEHIRQCRNGTACTACQSSAGKQCSYLKRWWRKRRLEVSVPANATAAQPRTISAKDSKRCKDACVETFASVSACVTSAIEAKQHISGCKGGKSRDERVTWEGG